MAHMYLSKNPRSFLQAVRILAPWPARKHWQLPHRSHLDASQALLAPRNRWLRGHWAPRTRRAPRNRLLRGHLGVSKALLAPPNLWLRGHWAPRSRWAPRKHLLRSHLALRSFENTGFETLDSETLSTVYGYARVHSSIYIYIYM